MGNTFYWLRSIEATGCTEKKMFQTPSVVVGDTPVKVDGPYFVVGIVLNNRERLGKGPLANGIPAGGRIQVQGVVRPLEVIEVSPSVEGGLAASQIGVGTSGEQLGLERPVEARELAESLGMVGSAVDYSDSQLDEPGGQRGEGMVEIIAPGRAVVHQHGVGHTIAAEDGGELFQDGLSPLVSTGPQPQREPGVVVQDRKGGIGPGPWRRGP